MSYKTTLAMLLFLGAVLLGFYFVQLDEVTKPASPSPKSTASMNQDTPLFEDPPADVVKITCTRAGQPTWRFVCDDPDGDEYTRDWHMVEPITASVPTTDMTGIVNRISRLKYQMKYAPGENGAVTLQRAGLDPPKMEIILESKGGDTHTIQIGHKATSSETYVRLDGGDDIYVVKASLDTVVKSDVNDYRDKVLFAFNAREATSLEIEHRTDDGESVEYRLVKNGDNDWVFEEPFTADADDATVEAAVRTISSLRASTWAVSNASGKLHRYGLGPPRLEIEVTCEEHTTVPVEQADGDEAEENDDAEPKTKDVVEIRQYQLLVAGRGPIGQDQQVYAMLAGSDAIATISKSQADKLTPVIDKWRDMDLVPGDVTTASKIAIQGPGGLDVVFAKNDVSRWVIQGSGEEADGASLRELLTKTNELRALDYVDGTDATDPKFGLEPPAARITITVPGLDQPERITVGGPTDQISKRLVYVRRGESESIAKIRAQDAEILQRNPDQYRDRDVVRLAISDIKRISLTRTNADTGSRDEFVLDRSDDGMWRMTKPVVADTDAKATEKLAMTLATLRATAVVARPVGDEFVPRGIDVTITSVAPAVVKLPPDHGNLEQATGGATIQTRLEFDEFKGGVFVSRWDRNPLYIIARSDYATLLADFHTKAVWDFESSEVMTVSVSNGSVTHGFRRSDDGWAYIPEPALPIEANKVDNLLLQIGDLKLKRFVSYGVADLAKYGLDNPAKRVTIRLEGGRSLELLVSAAVSTGTSAHDYYAAMKGSSDVFLLTPDTVSRLDIVLDQFEKGAGS
jgi:Domain of unknown function (DUF4340)